MPNIVINEIDNTSAGEIATNGDAVYVPGFALSAYEPNKDLDKVSSGVAEDIFFKKFGDGSTRYLKAKASFTKANLKMSKFEEYFLEGCLPTSIEEVDTFPDTAQFGKYYKCGNEYKVAWGDDTAATDAPLVKVEVQEGGYGIDEILYCPDIATFEAYFGKEPAKFLEDQGYPGNWASGSHGDGDKMFHSGDYDPAYLYAKELLAVGIPVYFERLNALGASPKTDTDFYTKLKACFTKDDGIIDNSEYDVKYLTTGGYPVLEYDTDSIVKAMLACAVKRGDAYALIDTTDYYERPLIGAGSVYNYVNGDDFKTYANLTFGTVVYPHYITNLPYTGIKTVMPASFAYLMCKASCLATGANWLAVAGATRGVVPYFIGLHTKNRLSNAIADQYQSRNGVEINGITKVEPYGTVIWGNSTLKNNALAGNETALSYLNVRDMMCDIKKQVFLAAKKCMFEQNTDILWVNFKSKIVPILETMKLSTVLSNYSLTKISTSEKGVLKAKIAIRPIYAVKDVYVDISIEDENVTVTGA